MIFYVHGGGFLDCRGSYRSPDIRAICTSFAQRGFIAISVETRLGAETPPKGDNTSYTTEQMLGIWRGGQDLRGAIRSSIYRELHNLEPFHIDTSKIFLAGNSAGAVIAMNVAFYNLNTMLASAFPGGINSVNVLGTINQNFYYNGGIAISYSIKGVLDLWGGILLPNPYDSTEGGTNPPENFFFQAGNKMPPVIAFCGAKDSTFRPTGKNLQFHPTGTHYPPDFLSTSFCLHDSTGATHYSVLSTNDTIYGRILGSQNIYEMFRQQHVYTELYIDCTMGHGLDDDNTAAHPNQFQSDFGTGLTNSADVNQYIVQRACVFFQSVISGKPYDFYKTTKFVECANYRSKCVDSPRPSCVTDSFPASQKCSQ